MAPSPITVASLRADFPLVYRVLCDVEYEDPAPLPVSTHEAFAKEVRALNDRVLALGGVSGGSPLSRAVVKSVIRQLGNNFKDDPALQFVVQRNVLLFLQHLATVDQAGFPLLPLQPGQADRVSGVINNLRELMVSGWVFALTHEPPLPMNVVTEELKRCTLSPKTPAQAPSILSPLLVGLYRAFFAVSFDSTSLSSYMAASHPDFLYSCGVANLSSRLPPGSMSFLSSFDVATFQANAFNIQAFIILYDQESIRPESIGDVPRPVGFGPLRSKAFETVSYSADEMRQVLLILKHFETVSDLFTSRSPAPLSPALSCIHELWLSEFIAKPCFSVICTMSSILAHCDESIFKLDVPFLKTLAPFLHMYDSLTRLSPQQLRLLTSQPQLLNKFTIMAASVASHLLSTLVVKGLASIEDIFDVPFFFEFVIDLFCWSSPGGSVFTKGPEVGITPTSHVAARFTRTFSLSYLASLLLSLALYSPSIRSKLKSKLLHSGRLGSFVRYLREQLDKTSADSGYPDLNGKALDVICQVVLPAIALDVISGSTLPADKARTVDLVFCRTLQLTFSEMKSFGLVLSSTQPGSPILEFLFNVPEITAAFFLGLTLLFERCVASNSDVFRFLSPTGPSSTLAGRGVRGGGGGNKCKELLNELTLLCNSSLGVLETLIGFVIPARHDADQALEIQLMAPERVRTPLEARSDRTRALPIINCGFWRSLFADFALSMRRLFLCNGILNVPSMRDREVRQGLDDKAVAHYSRQAKAFRRRVPSSVAKLNPTLVTLLANELDLYLGTLEAHERRVERLLLQMIRLQGVRRADNTPPGSVHMILGMFQGLAARGRT